MVLPTMEIRVGFWLIALIVTLCSAGVEAQTYKLMAYNIHHGYDQKEEPRLEEMAGLIRQARPRFVGLVEVDSMCERSNKVDQAAFLGKKTGLHHTFVRHFPYQGGAYGLAFLSEFPILEVMNKRLPIESTENGDSTRAALFCRVSPAVGKTLLVVVLHSDYRSEQARIIQVRVLLDLLKDEKGPVVMMGDLNTAPDSPSMNLLKQHFVDTGDNDHFTFPADSPSKRIDYILVNKKHLKKTRRAQVYPINFSDHRPVAVKVSFK